MTQRRSLPWDWYPGAVPENVLLHDTAYVETSFSFYLFRGERPEAVSYARGASTYLGTMFDVGARGRVRLGECALVHGARIICDEEIVIGDYSLISWNVVLMDTYRVAAEPQKRREELVRVPERARRFAETQVPARPVHIGPNVWIGFEACVLPGVSIGEGSIVGARSVVFETVPPFTIVAGNPARVIRAISAEERARAATGAVPDFTPSA